MISEPVSQDASMTLLATKLNIVEYTTILVSYLSYQSIAVAEMGENQGAQ
mgnify:CR=1 FL=1